MSSPNQLGSNCQGGKGMRFILLLLGCFLLSLVIALDCSVANPRNLGECINAHQLLFQEIETLMPMAPPEYHRDPDRRIFPLSGYQNTFHHCLESLRRVQAGAATLRGVISRASPHGGTPVSPGLQGLPAGTPLWQCQCYDLSRRIESPPLNPGMCRSGRIGPTACELPCPPGLTALVPVYE